MVGVQLSNPKITMSNTGILLAGFGAVPPKIAVDAARSALPGASFTAVKNLQEALDREPTGGPEVLVLARPTAGDLARAVDAVDAGGLPRWAVVALDANPGVPEVETLPADDWNERTVARALRSAWERHGLNRELARARGDLLAIGTRVAHDLRTQVAGILASAELLREILEEGEPARAELIQPIFDSVDGLEQIIVHLSFLAKVSARAAAKKRMDMGDVVFRALQRLEGEIRRRNASIVQPAYWPEVVGEAPWVEAIWCNLVGNALKYGDVRPQIELGWMQEEDEHRFCIRDSGVGVPPEKRSQLFQPFHLLHRKNSPRGLGLPLAQRLVELQGGRCGYAPREERGSDFYFTLPTPSANGHLAAASAGK